jgi:hypothetical protein
LLTLQNVQPTKLCQANCFNNFMKIEPFWFNNISELFLLISWKIECPDQFSGWIFIFHYSNTFPTPSPMLNSES